MHLLLMIVWRILYQSIQLCGGFIFNTTFTKHSNLLIFHKSVIPADLAPFTTTLAELSTQTMLLFNDFKVFNEKVLTFSK